MREKIRLLTTLILAVLLVLIGWSAISFVSRLGKSKVSVQAIPDDSIVIMNGKKIHAGTLYLSPGKYVFNASRKDFSPVQKTIVVQKGLSPQSVYLLPVPDTAAAIEYLNSHPEIQQARERQGATNSENTQSSLTQKYPITSKLPTYTSDYRIDYSLDNNQSLSFSITLYAILNNPQQYSEYRQQLLNDKAEALQFLKSNNINPDDYSITYTPNI